MNHNLFLVDDHSMLRKGIIAYLNEKTNWQVIGDFLDSKSCRLKILVPVVLFPRRLVMMSS